MLGAGANYVTDIASRIALYVAYSYTSFVSGAGVTVLLGSHRAHRLRVMCFGVPAIARVIASLRTAAGLSSGRPLWWLCILRNM